MISLCNNRKNETSQSAVNWYTNYAEINDRVLDFTNLVESSEYKDIMKWQNVRN